jgi:urease accessory protein
LARLLQLVSPALPIGGFAYSRGLETAVELGWVADATRARAWIGGLLRRNAGTLDAPLLLRLHAAWVAGDRAAVERWARFGDAARESAELQLESRRVGASLARLLRDLDVASTEELASPVGESHLATFALAAARFGLDAPTAARAYLWTWLEAQVTAAVKLVPLGQTDGQRILLALGPELDEVVRDAAALDDSEIGALTPGLALASALHETQHTRLFRS